jgi:hypothetical protein
VKEANPGDQPALQYYPILDHAGEVPL